MDAKGETINPFFSLVYFVKRLFFHNVLRVNLINFLWIASFNLIVLELHF